MQELTPLRHARQLTPSTFMSYQNIYFLLIADLILIVAFEP